MTIQKETAHHKLLEEFQRQAFNLMTQYMNESMAILVEQGYGEWEIKEIIAKQRHISGVIQKQLAEAKSLGESLSLLRSGVKNGLDVNGDIIRFDQWWLFTAPIIMDSLIGWEPIKAQDVAKRIKQNVDLKLNFVKMGEV